MHKAAATVGKESARMALETLVVLRRERPKHSGILLQVAQSHFSDNIHQCARDTLRLCQALGLQVSPSRDAPGIFWFFKLQ